MVMNKYIKSDLESSKTHMKAAVMNVLDAIEKDEIKDFDFGKYVPYNIVKECLESRGWKRTEDFDTNGWEYDFWDVFESPNNPNVVCSISGSLVLGGLKILKENE